MSDWIYIKGKLSYIRLSQPDQLYNCWSIAIHPEPDDLEVIRDLQANDGLKNVLKKDDDGYYTTFRRPVSKAMKGIVRTFEPPIVIDKDKNPIDPNTIGDGSDAIVQLEIYEYNTPSKKKAKAARLAKVRIENLVPKAQQVEGTEELTGQPSYF